MLDDPALAEEFLVRECAVPPAGAEQIVRYLRVAREALGACPRSEP